MLGITRKTDEHMRATKRQHLDTNENVRQVREDIHDWRGQELTKADGKG